MKKRFFALLFAVLLCVGLTLTVSAAQPKIAEVVDEADLLTDQQEAALTVRLTEVAGKYDISLVVLTISSRGGASIHSYADDYYDYNGYREDGAVLVLDMSDRKWYVSTKGVCIDKIDYEEVGEDILDSLRDDRYYDAFMEFADSCGDQMAPPYLMTFVICLAIGLVIALIITGSMRSKMKSVRAKGSAADYVCEGSMHVSTSRDLYLYTTHTRTAKPKDNDSSSGGSHTSSSGSDHGGGGGSF